MHLLTSNSISATDAKGIFFIDLNTFRLSTIPCGWQEANTPHLSPTVDEALHRAV